LPIEFNATLSIANQVAYDPSACADMSAASPAITTVQQAIDFLCKEDHGCCCIPIKPGEDANALKKAIDDLIKREIFDICICLCPGDHRVHGLELDRLPPNVRLHIVGCGRATRVTLQLGATFGGLKEVTLRELEVIVSFMPRTGVAAITFDS